jgi:hypothetical protein
MLYYKIFGWHVCMIAISIYSLLLKINDKYLRKKSLVEVK